MKYLPLVLSLLFSGLAVANTSTESRSDAAQAAINTDQYSACSLTSKEVYVQPEGGLPVARQLESMSSPYGWSGTASTLQVSDNVLKTTGTVHKVIQEPFSTDWGTLAIPVCHDFYTPANQNGGVVSISNGEKSINIGGINYLGGYHAINGKGWRYLSAQTLIDYGFKEGDQLTLTIKNSASAPYSSYTGWGKLLKKAQGVPTLVLTFDDGGQGPWNQLEYSQQRGIKGTIFYPWSFEGRSNKLSVSQLKDLKDAGWDIELNGTGNDAPMTSLENTDVVVEQLIEGRKWLAENGLNDHARFFCLSTWSL